MKHEVGGMVRWELGEAAAVIISSSVPGLLPHAICNLWATYFGELDLLELMAEEVSQACFPRLDNF